MSNAILFDQIIDKLRTTSDVAQVLLCLEEFTDTFFSTKTHAQQQQIFQILSKQIGDILTGTLAKDPITPENQITIKRTIDELTDKLRDCKSMKMTLAFQPNDDTISLFSDWIKKNIRKDLLIDLQFDKAIVGGAVIIAEGIYKDYSVRKNLSNRFQIQRDEIMSLLD